jgi:hypothetical protein
MHPRLIDRRTGEERDAQLLKPVRPLVTKMALDSDLIDRKLDCFAIWAHVCSIFFFSPSCLHHLDDDIPRFAPRCDIPVRLDHVFQRKAAIDDRFDLTRLNQPIDEG